MLEAQERNVGPFRADLLCKDISTDHWVLIENQIERTDHSHLGQLLTYAAGLSAVTIVWIAQRFTEEHRAALDWLNEVTSEEISFYGLEIELWRIGDSPAAPKFNVVSKPNSFVKQQVAQRAAAQAGPYAAYWGAFCEYLKTQQTRFNRNAGSDSWLNFPVGRSNYGLRTSASMQNRTLCVDFVIFGDADKQIFDSLLPRRGEIDERIPGLIWNRKDGKKESCIEFWSRDFDPKEKETWDEQHTWLVSKLLEMDKVFCPLVKGLP